MTMPKKDPTLKRSGKVIAYLQPATHEAFQRAAEEQGISVSALASQLIEDFISSTKKDQESSMENELVRVVLRVLAEEGLLSKNIFGANLSPKINKPSQETGANLSLTSVSPTPEATGIARKSENGIYPTSRPKRRMVVGRRDDDKH